MATDDAPLTDDEYVQAATALAGCPPEHLRDAVIGLLEQTPGRAPERLTAAVSAVAGRLVLAEPEAAALLSLFVGSLVEQGADPTVGIGPVLDTFESHAFTAVEFVKACVEAVRAEAGVVQADEGGERVVELGEAVERQGATVAAERPGLAEGFTVAHGATQAALAMLGRSPAARQVARSRPDVQRLADELPNVFLPMLLRVLDGEDLVVVDRTTGRGFAVTIGGLADNFQLHTLLADALIDPEDPERLPGERPDWRVVAAAQGAPPAPGCPSAEGRWNLVAHDGSWIWNEGSPADIPFLDDVDGAGGARRVVVLDPPPFARSWSVEPRFAWMAPSLVASPLPAERAAAVLARCWPAAGPAADPGAAAPG